MNEQLTDWYPGNTVPVRIGVYERNDRIPYLAAPRGAYSYWDGSFWHTLDRDINRAATNVAFSNFQLLPWRGLASDPNA